MYTVNKSFLRQQTSSSEDCEFKFRYDSVVAAKMSGSDDDYDDRHRRKRRRRSSSSSSRSERNARRRRTTDFDFYRSKLARIFFREADLIRYGSEEYRDFWKFYAKYRAVEAAKKSKKDQKTLFPSDVRSSGHLLGISSVYRKESTQSFRLLPSDSRDLINRLPLQDPDDREGFLTEDMAREFQHVLGVYVDFLQREKFRKLKKLRQGQADLPIAEYRGEIIAKLTESQVVIVAGDTGCGKSTQVPQYLLAAGYENVACTQPRRIACISLAKRVGYETLNEYGSEIGYQIRFERKRTDRTRVLFLTEGLLLRQVATDASLSAYSVIVLDEVHERHLHGDFLLGIVKCLVQQRPDLKVVLMSATINIKLFQDYFDGEAPVIQVPGRLYPIKLNYFPVPCVEKSSSSDKLNPAPYVRILQLIDQKYSEKERGDVLIFLSGIKEITTVAEACHEYGETNNRWIVLQLHSTLSLADQDKVFDYPPEGVRKCIVSTNIAETSITIDGVRFVVDSGKVKEMQYDPVCKMQRLKEFWISRASAEQRKGRAGRTGPGVCFRLFEQAEYKALEPFSTPEIQRVPLDNLILQMLSMGLPDARKFPFIEPPPVESIENSILVLKEQGALNDDESLTVTGRMLASLPVDVSIGKMLIMGTLFHQIESVLSLASALSVQSPFTNKAYRDSDCVAARRNLDSDHGDPITLLNAFREWLQVKTEERENSRKWCKKRGLEEQRFYEMTKLRAQFKELLEQASLLSKDTDMSQMSSVERVARHGELKQLREMKKDYLKKEGPRKKKILKMRGMDDLEAEEANDNGVDLKDIEFRMRNNDRQVRTLLEGTRAYSYKDLTMLKLILASGLYPQLAVADEFNHAKGGADALFHTKVKPFNVLHPNCIFAASPEYLALDSTDIVQVPGFPAKYPASSKHQILVYLSLLETNKPYVMNALRMPALQTLLLFAHSIDTNAAISRLVFDSWLELKFPDPEQAQNMLLKAGKLRSLWQRLLGARLAETLDVIEEETLDKSELAVMEARLSSGLVDFVHSEAVFSLRRLLPGDIKVLYTGPGQGHVVEVTDNPFSSSAESWPHEKKGGVMLSDYLVYNCVASQVDELDLVLVNWKCPICDESMYTGPLSRMCHYSQCLDKEEDVKAKEQVTEIKSSNPLARDFYCDQCQKSYRLTSIDILKHKKSHAAGLD